MTSIDEDGRLWVLKKDQTKREGHITLIGTGPKGMTLKAPDEKTMIEYLGSKPEFDVEMMEGGSLWIFSKEETKEKSEKHATGVGGGRWARR